jgi:hypothetical protein
MPMYEVPPAHRPPGREPLKPWIVGIVVFLILIGLLCVCAALALDGFADGLR